MCLNVLKITNCSSPPRGNLKLVFKVVCETLTANILYNDKLKYPLIFTADNVEPYCDTNTVKNQIVCPLPPKITLTFEILHERIITHH